MHHGLSRLPDSLFGQSGSLCMSGLASSYQLNNRGTVRGSEEAYSSRQPLQPRHNLQSKLLQSCDVLLSKGSFCKYTSGAEILIVCVRHPCSAGRDGIPAGQCSPCYGSLDVHSRAARWQERGTKLCTPVHESDVWPCLQIMWRYTMLYVTERCYESGGRVWDQVFNNVCWCLFICIFFTGTSP